MLALDRKIFGMRCCYLVPRQTESVVVNVEEARHLACFPLPPAGIVSPLNKLGQAVTRSGILLATVMRGRSRVV